MGKSIFRNFIINPILIALILCCVSCYAGVGKIFPNRPTKDFKHFTKDASPDFIKGWNDGCEVGMANGSNTFYKIFYHNNRVDGYKMTGSPDYKTGWGNAFWFCYRQDYIRHKSSPWGSFLNGYK